MFLRLSDSPAQILCTDSLGRGQRGVPTAERGGRGESPARGGNFSKIVRVVTKFKPAESTPPLRKSPPVLGSKPPSNDAPARGPDPQTAKLRNEKSQHATPTFASQPLHESGVNSQEGLLNPERRRVAELPREISKYAEIARTIVCSTGTVQRHIKHM